MAENEHTAENDTPALAEPPRWSVVWTKDDDTTWLNVGRHYEPDGSWWWAWVSTHAPQRVSKWSEMDVACILAWGLDEPILPGQDQPRVLPPAKGEAL